MSLGFGGAGGGGKGNKVFPAAGPDPEDPSLLSKQTTTVDEEWEGKSHKGRRLGVMNMTEPSAQLALLAVPPLEVAGTVGSWTHAADKQQGPSKGPSSKPSLSRVNSCTSVESAESYVRMESGLRSMISQASITSRKHGKTGLKAAMQGTGHAGFTRPKWVIFEDDSRYRLWWAITLFAAVLTGFLEPLAVAFGPTPRLKPYLNVYDMTRLICIPLFITDGVLTFFLAYPHPTTGALVTDLKLIRRHYLKSRFWLDFVAWFPFDKLAQLILLAAHINPNENIENWLALIRLTALIRMYRLYVFYAQFDYNTKLNQTVLVLVRNNSYILFTTHWGACIFWWIARAEGFPSQSWVGRQFERFEDQPMMVQYVYALYWSVTCFGSVGDGALYTGSTVAEAGFMVVYVLFNITLGAYILGTTTMLVVKGDKKTKVYRDRVKQLTHYAELHHIPEPLVHVMQDHLDLHFRHEEVSDEQVLGHFPTTLRKKVLRHLYYQNIKDCYLFQGTSNAFIDLVLSSARLETIMPQVQILSDTDHASELYIIMSGHVEVFRRTLALTTPTSGPSGGGAAADLPEGLKREVLSERQAIGEISFFTEMENSMLVKSVGLVRCLVLSRSQYNSIAAAHPMDNKRVVENLMVQEEEALVTEIRDAVVSNQASKHPDRFLLQCFSPACTMSDIEQVVSSKQLRKLGMRTRKMIEELMYARTVVLQYVQRVEAQRVAEFTQAAVRGDVDTVKKMLLQGMDQDTQDGDGRTALLLAAARGNVEVVQLLLHSGADPSVLDANGNSAMFEACKRGHDDIVELLLLYDAPMNVPDPVLATEMRHCILEGNMKQLALLLKAKANADAMDHDQRSPLHIAAQCGNLAAVKVLIEEGHGHPHTADRWNHHPIDEALMNNHPSVVEYLQQLLSPEQCEEAQRKWRDRQAAEFMTACSHDNRRRVQQLLDKGCHPNTYDHNQRSGLLVAAAAGHVHILRMLLQAGADPSHRDISGNSAMLEACKHGHDAAVDLLVREGAMLHMPGNEMAALMCNTVHSKDGALLKRLLVAGAPAAARDYHDSTALHVAARLGDLEAVKLLLELSDIPIDVRDCWGNTPLDEARKAGHPEVQSYLETMARDPGARQAAQAGQRAALEQASAAWQRQLEEEEARIAAERQAAEEEWRKVRSATAVVAQMASMSSKKLKGIASANDLLALHKVSIREEDGQEGSDEEDPRQGMRSPNHPRQLRAQSNTGAGSGGIGINDLRALSMRLAKVPRRAATQRGVEVGCDEGGDTPNGELQPPQPLHPILASEGSHTGGLHPAVRFSSGEALPVRVSFNGTEGGSQGGSKSALRNPHNIRSVVPPSQIQQQQQQSQGPGAIGSSRGGGGGFARVSLGQAQQQHPLIAASRLGMQQQPAVLAGAGQSLPGDSARGPGRAGTAPSPSSSQTAAGSIGDSAYQGSDGPIPQAWPSLALSGGGSNSGFNRSGSGGSGGSGYTPSPLGNGRLTSGGGSAASGSADGGDAGYTFVAAPEPQPAVLPPHIDPERLALEREVLATADRLTRERSAMCLPPTPVDPLDRGSGSPPQQADATLENAAASTATDHPPEMPDRPSVLDLDVVETELGVPEALARTLTEIVPTTTDVGSPAWRGSSSSDSAVGSVEMSTRLDLDRVTRDVLGGADAEVQDTAREGSGRMTGHGHRL